MAYYDRLDEVVAALSRAGYPVQDNEVEVALEALDLHLPLGDADVKELRDYLQGRGMIPDSHLVRVMGVLSGKDWAKRVESARAKLGLPPAGKTPEEARTLYRHYMEFWAALAGRLIISETGQADLQVGAFWHDSVREARLLAPVLQIDPTPLDRVWEKYGRGELDPLIGIGKLLAPEIQILKGEQELPFDPARTDRLVGHVVWGMDILAEEMVQRPSIGLRYQYLAGDVCTMAPTIFGFDRASPKEIRELRQMQKELMANEKRFALLRSLGWGNTWKDRWERWNRWYPEWAFTTPDALRKAVEAARAASAQ